MDIMIDTEIQALITNLHHAVNNHSKKKLLFSVLSLKGHLGQKNQINVVPSLVVFNCESGAKVKLKLNQRLHIEK